MPDKVSNIFGFFDNPGQERPAYDPGLAVPCPICLLSLADNALRTVSLMKPGDRRSYFFRAHKGCWDEAPVHEKDRIEHSLIDASPDDA